MSVLRRALVVACFSSGLAQAAARHEVRVALDPAAHRLKVEDTIEVGAEGPRTVRFLLHAGLSPSTSTVGARLRKLARAPEPADFGASPARWTAPVAPVELWEATLPAGAGKLTLVYGGVLDHPVVVEEQEQARGFSETPGTIGPDGVYLTGTSVWIPWTDDGPFPFSVTIDLPAGWDAVSQGRRAGIARSAAATQVTWESPEPQTEVTLVAGRFVETSRKVGKIETMAFLRERDDALAGKYLDATERYLRMYEELLGPYPYAKFALVENFWETGYGFPSFTLLGSKVIRLPFLLQTSYPHEILHDWWGNGVFVDPARGNWSEGLTAYLADHLLAEQSGDASEYRQSALQRYADYVSTGKDFPLTAFRERHSPASEAVGYGKALLLFHETRNALGDQVFVTGLRKFYEKERFREASFDDLRRALEEASGKDLGAAFRQALERTGAPRLALRGVSVVENGGRWRVRGTLLQLQDGAPYLLDVPLAVTVEGKPAAEMGSVRLAGKEARFEIAVPGRPLRLDADPAFDLFRRLDTAEVPPALSGALGAERVLAIVPAAAPEPMQEAYRTLARTLAPEPGRLELRTDAEATALPSDRSVWVLGWENRLVPQVGQALAGYGAGAEKGGVRLPDLARGRDGLAVTTVTSTLAWIAADTAAQLPGLARKLPHYGKYSYLAFEGGEPTNVAKGRWPVLRSPLTSFLADGAAVPRAALPRRKPLAVPPPEIATEPLAKIVRALAAPEMEGRAPGSEGHARAVALVETEMRAAGVAVEKREVAAEAWGRTLALTNVLGRVPGTRTDWKRQVIVIGAHLDHLGTGWPDARAGNAGKLHPGADDDASGMAALLALAREFASGPPPERTLLFAAFDGEEAGRLGSKRLVEELASEGTEVFAMVNLDSVGRLGEGKLLVLGCGTASEWPHVFRGASFVTGVPVEPVAADPGGSDQLSFQERGVPAVQLFTGPHADYHTPGDTADKVDVPGIAKVVSVAREGIAYLAGRAEPLTRPGAAPSAGPAEGGARKVGLGTVPDFAYSGPGVRLSGVTPGSPAERAGLAAGDVLVEVNGEAVPDLRAYSAALKRLSAGDRVQVTYERNGARKVVEVEAVPR